ncbi:MAG: HNH endonuclease [Gemmataceae bacterium]|nr:HNH endonuclease [Gemmataceae bacterium]
MTSALLLDSNVLVLNRLFQAVHVTSVRKAFALFYKGHVRAVEPDYTTYSFENWRDITPGADDEFISTPSYRIRIPRVVQLLYFDELPRHEVRFTRKNIYFRDRNRCQYCGGRFATKDLNLDHVTPLSRGGRSTWDNVVCCCVDCNTRKGNRLPVEAGLALLKQPTKPRWHPLVRLSLTHSRYEVWKNFLDLAYWNVELQDEPGLTPP